MMCINRNGEACTNLPNSYIQTHKISTRYTHYQVIVHNWDKSVVFFLQKKKKTNCEEGDFSDTQYMNKMIKNYFHLILCMIRGNLV